MIDRVLTLFKTFLEIVLFRKGPADLPNSSFLFVVVATIWFVVQLVAVVLVDEYRSSGLFIDLILAFVGLGLYALIINVFGQTARMMSCFSALLGCSAVFGIVLYLGRAILPTLLSANEAEWILQIIWLWSIPVEGHIIARTINRQWVLGFLVAVGVLIAQLQLLAVIRPLMGTAA